MARRRTLVTGLAAVTAMVAGCSFTGEFGNGYRCGDDERCPPGATCVGGFCAARPDAEVPGARCGTLSLLQDTFGDGVSGVYWDSFAEVGASVFETGGHLAVQLGAGTASPYAGYTSVFLYDLTGGRFEPAVSQVGGATTLLEVRTHDDVRVQLVAERGDLIATVFGGPSPGRRASVPYDPIQHAYWRVREADGTLFWEAAPDRATWTALWSEPVAFEIEHVQGILAAGGQLVAASEARFDDVNDGASPGSFCPIHTLVDDFDEPPLRPIWANWTDGLCTVVEAGGELVMDFTGAGESFCGIGSRHLFDLRDSELVLDATAIPAQPMFVAYLQVIRPGDDDTHLEISLEGTTLAFEQSVDDVNVAANTILHSATEHRYWRLRERAGTVSWDTSPDAVTWTTRGEAPAQFDLSRVQVVLGAGHYGTGPGVPATARFGRIN